MLPPFTPENVKVAYESRFHFGWYARGRQPKLASIASHVYEWFRDVAIRQNYHILEFECKPFVLRALLSLKPDVSPADVTRFVKGNLATAVRPLGVSALWFRGWFVRSAGHVTNDTVRDYVEGQYEHHNTSSVCTPAAAAKACFQHPGDPSNLRTSSHAKFEYNLHVVLVTAFRREFLDLHVAESLVAYLRNICDMKKWIPWNIQVVWDHAHLFLGVSPHDSPGGVALSLLNNLEYFMGQRFGAALRDEVDRTFWQPGYYMGAVGSATTAQVKAFLASSAPAD